MIGLRLAKLLFEKRRFSPFPSLPFTQTLASEGGAKLEIFPKHFVYDLFAVDNPSRGVCS